jgi:dTDP-4-dehydrorhamnose 3,5-epimerase-like enzyme
VTRALEIVVDTRYPINDLYILKLNQDQQETWRSLKAYAFENHLLKRIGLVELVELSAGDTLPAFIRHQADELWILYKGQANFHWQDQRESSPTFKEVYSLDAESPIRVLVPFGVQFSVTAKTYCNLLRISSHAGDLSTFLIDAAES